MARFIDYSATLLPTSGVVQVDASGFDRSHASKHYAKRAEFRIQQLRVTLLVDTKVNAIPDLHVTATRKHDSQIAPSLIKRNSANIDILLGTKATMTRKSDGLPVNTEASTHQVSGVHITSHGVERTLSPDLYGQRSQSETVNSTLKRKYGAFVRSQRWWKQSRELTIACLIRNIDRSL
ncbi:transposase [Haloterrigena gelatinilytica]|uniref:transposase n=1 Tax=Haloterrigena gelatinilytica TaxID=2741724 RepID=UPI0037430F62